MLLHYNDYTNELTRCYITNIDDDTLFSKLNTLDKTLEEYNKSLQEAPNKIWYSQNCNSFAFYDPYLYSCVRRQRDGQINIYLCLNIKMCNKLITIMCAPTVAGERTAYGLYIDGVPNDEASTIVQTYVDNYCREEKLSQLSDDRRYNPWSDTIFIDGEVSLDGDTYLINVYESITLCKPSEDYIFNYVYIDDCNTYVLPPKGSTLIEDLVSTQTSCVNQPIEVPSFAGSTPETIVQTSGVTESYEQLGRRLVSSMPNYLLTPDDIAMLLGFDPSVYNSVRTEVSNTFEDEEVVTHELELPSSVLPDASILDELA